MYLAISLTKLYQKIKEETSNEKGVKFADFTSFLCNVIISLCIENIRGRPWLDNSYEVDPNVENNPKHLQSARHRRAPAPNPEQNLAVETKNNQRQEQKRQETIIKETSLKIHLQPLTKINNNIRSPRLINNFI